MLDPWHIWDVIYNARNNKSHSSTSPKTAPATQNESHDWSAPHMKRHLQCAEQQKSSSNFTKYCPSYAKWMIDPHHIWNVICDARSNKSHPPTSPNTAPPTQNESHDWSASHRKRHLQCTEQQESSSNFTKYCACHAKWISWLIRITYEMLFTMRGATRVTFQPHQILRLPQNMTRMIASRHIWNVIYNARSNTQHRPTSPNTAPATQNASCTTRGRSDHGPTMIRTWSDHELVISHPPVRRGYFSRFGDAFCNENYNISRSGYLPKFT